MLRKQMVSFSVLTSPLQILIYTMPPAACVLDMEPKPWKQTVEVRRQEKEEVEQRGCCCRWDMDSVP